MADISGPCSTLPGSLHKPSVAATCDDHPERLAVKRIQGETDSFGAEYLDMCQECFDKHVSECETLDRSGTCDWCNSHAPSLRPLRDLDEGSYGRVYSVCDGCIQRENSGSDDDLNDTEPYDFSDLEEGPDYSESESESESDNDEDEALYELAERERMDREDQRSVMEIRQ